MDTIYKGEAVLNEFLTSRTNFVKIILLVWI